MSMKVNYSLTQRAAPISRGYGLDGADLPIGYTACLLYTSDAADE